MQLYQNNPRKIGNNLVISNTEMVRNSSMFLTIPPKSDLYKKLGNEFGMFLIKTGDKKMVFRSEKPINCGEYGQNHLDLNINFPGKNINFDLGLFRLICCNGLECFEKLNGVQFNNVLKNKINTDSLINRFSPKMQQIEDKVNKIQKIELNEDEKYYISNGFIKRMNDEDSFKYLTNHDKMKQKDINHMLNLLSNNELTKPNRLEDYGTNLWTTYNTVQENAIKIVKNFKNNTLLENKLLLDIIKPLYQVN